MPTQTATTPARTASATPRPPIRHAAEASIRVADFRARHGLPDSVPRSLRDQARAAWQRHIVGVPERGDHEFFVLRDISRRVPTYLAVRAATGEVFALGPGDPVTGLASLRRDLLQLDATVTFRI